MQAIEFILYVSNQQESTLFYEYLFQQKAILNVPGMTEFQLSENVKLGLMPNDGIAKILGNKTPHPTKGNGIPRCELYIKVPNPQAYMLRGIEKGAILVSNLEPRDWGDAVGYIADINGHILAFAEQK